MHRFASLAIASLIALAACGGAAAPSAQPSLTSTPTVAAATATATPSAFSGLRIEASAGKSTATVKVREQLADLKAPSDAILTTTSVSGQILLRSDGTFAEGSKIVVDVTTLASDRSQRDQFIKRSTLETSKYPSATFVLKRAEGLPAPLPASGEWAVKLVGDMMIHGVTKEITWDATIKRAAGGVTGKATTSFRFGDFGMQVPSVFTVLSIVDSINLQLDFVGTAA